MILAANRGQRDEAVERLAAIGVRAIRIPARTPDQRVDHLLDDFGEVVLAPALGDHLLITADGEKQLLAFHQARACQDGMENLAGVGHHGGGEDQHSPPPAQAREPAERGSDVLDEPRPIRRGGEVARGEIGLHHGIGEADAFFAIRHQLPAFVDQPVLQSARANSRPPRASARMEISGAGGSS